MWIYRNRIFIIIADALLLCSAFYVSHLIRFEFSIPAWAFDRFMGLLGVGIVIKILCFSFFDLYRGMWRYSSINDFMNIGKAASVGSLLLVAFVLYTIRFEGVSRSVFIMDWLLTLFFISGLRLGIRLSFEKVKNDEKKGLIDGVMHFFSKRHGRDIGLLIIGAGDCGEKICREIKDNASVHYDLMGFLDDDPAKINRKIHGVTVLDAIDNLGFAVKSTGAKEVIIAIPSLSAGRMREIVSLCDVCGIKYKTVPSLGELINGKVSVKTIRGVEYRDLLGRDPVSLDQASIGSYIGGRVVFITGAGGSIGKGLCEQICRYAPAKIILFERAESPLYDIELELKKAFKHVEVIAVLGDIRDAGELESVFLEHHPEIVFHAAAYKHVPMLEACSWKAIENNIEGTRLVAKTAVDFQCDKFVLVSTDKAVNPTNVMGASKRITEMIAQGMGNGSTTKFITVRFGNVIGSAGSVIPLFKKQIEQGGPVTVTHPDVIRYFMLIPEACQLILQAGAMGEGGEIFILEMGDPVKIDSMARDLIRFSGFEPDKDITIEYTGLRPGEKLYEELIKEGEGIVATDHKKIMVLSGQTCELTQLNGNIDRLIETAKTRDGKKIREIIKQMVPEYKSDTGI